MSSLMPELRADKNGKLVTRHVRNEQSSGFASSLPAPSLPMESKEERTRRLASECVQMISDARKAYGWVALSRSMEEFLSDALRLEEGLAEDMHALLPSLDEHGFHSIFNGINDSRPSRLQDPGRLALVVRAYPYCRTVDDAIPAGETVEEHIRKHNLWDVSSELMGGNQRLVVDDENVADLESTYLLSKLDLDESSFPIKGDYYRALSKLKNQQEELKPYLPLLFAFCTIRSGRNKESNWYFNDSWYLWENIKLAKGYPAEHIPAIAAETIRRGDFNDEIAQQIMDNNASSLNDGLL